MKKPIKYSFYCFLLFAIILLVFSTIEVNIVIENQFFDYLLIIKKNYFETVFTTFLAAIEIVIK